MNKIELVKELSRKTKVSQRQTAELIDAFIATVLEKVRKGEKVSILGFGKFEMKQRAARKGVNPQTGDVMKIPAKKVPVFVSGKQFKQAVNK